MGESEALGELREEDPHERLEGHVTDEYDRSAEDDAPPAVKGMNTAITAMNGMSGRKKVCQRSSPPRARNVTM